MINKLLIFIVTALLLSFSLFTPDNEAVAQDIPELHMLVFQGDIFISGIQNSDIDGLTLEAKIGSTVLGSIEVAKSTTSSRYVALEVGPNENLEGQDITFWIGNQKAEQSVPFGPTTPSGTYCKGCSWVLPLSKTLDLNFSSFPVATPTPVPASAAPAFLTGNVIFGSVLSAPEELTDLQAYIGDLLVGSGSVSGPNFSITIDPGTVEYIGKEVTFKIAGTDSKTTYIFQEDDFQTTFKLFFPEYIPPQPTATPIPANPTATPLPDPTRTPTPVPDPTPTYTPTPTPTPVILTSNSQSSQNDILAADSPDGGCNSRGGGPASVGLIILSLAPAYLLNRSRKRKSV